MLTSSKYSRKYTEEEKNIVRQYYNPKDCKKSCEYMSKHFLQNRSAVSIRKLASRLGLTRTRQWTEAELAIIEEYAERLPACSIRLKLKKLWDKEGLPYRSADAVKLRINIRGYSTLCEGEYFTLKQIAAGLRCSNNNVYGWMKVPKYVEILKPVLDESLEKPARYISLSNFRKFVKTYPGEIARHNVDTLWLLTVVFDCGT